MSGKANEAEKAERTQQVLEHFEASFNAARRQMHRARFKKGGFLVETALTYQYITLGYEVPRQVVPEGVVETVWSPSFIAVVERRLNWWAKVRKMTADCQSGSGLGDHPGPGEFRLVAESQQKIRALRRAWIANQQVTRLDENDSSRRTRLAGRNGLRGQHD